MAQNSLKQFNKFSNARRERINTKKTDFIAVSMTIDDFLSLNMFSNLLFPIAIMQKSYFLSFTESAGITNGGNRRIDENGGGSNTFLSLRTSTKNLTECLQMRRKGPGLLN
jgi:hypothetical protein